MDLRKKFLKSLDMDAVYTSQIYMGDDIFSPNIWADLLQTELYDEALERIQAWLIHGDKDIFRIECLERLDDGVHIRYDVYYANV